MVTGEFFGEYVESVEDVGVAGDGVDYYACYEREDEAEHHEGYYGADHSEESEDEFGGYGEEGVDEGGE